MSDLVRADPPRWRDLPSGQQVRIRKVLHRMAWRRARQGRLCLDPANEERHSLPKQPRAAVTGRIGLTHLERLAIVYVRQSTLQQIEHNQELNPASVRFGRARRPLGWSARPSGCDR